ncbi:SHOCT domain-containing protein [Micromonospora echinospora]|uniref:Membrane protein n=1 Tax=Micromonospora echinospora TaxID=1877 RepID=A0ABR6M7F4_MICEC|nr:SHOCT domain-containing protein [Micromonospora echinospora]MBB5111288.1 putative membrane protein [Micromonospora echinospora]
MMWQSPMMGWMWIWSLAVLVVLAGLLWLAVRWTGPQQSGPTTARRILDERYARGEIDEDEYRRRRAGLA